MSQIKRPYFPENDDRFKELVFGYLGSYSSLTRLSVSHPDLDVSEYKLKCENLSKNIKKEYGEVGTNYIQYIHDVEAKLLIDHPPKKARTIDEVYEAIADYLVNNSLEESERDSVAYLKKEFMMAEITSRTLLKEYRKRFGHVPVVMTKDVVNFIHKILCNEDN